MNHLGLLFSIFLEFKGYGPSFLPQKDLICPPMQIPPESMVVYYTFIYMFI